MGRIEKIKRKLIEEANKKILSETDETKVNLNTIGGKINDILIKGVDLNKQLENVTLYFGYNSNGEFKMFANDVGNNFDGVVFDGDYYNGSIGKNDRVFTPFAIFNSNPFIDLFNGFTGEDKKAFETKGYYENLDPNMSIKDYIEKGRLTVFLSSLKKTPSIMSYENLGPGAAAQSKCSNSKKYGKLGTETKIPINELLFIGDETITDSKSICFDNGNSLMKISNSGLCVYTMNPLKSIFRSIHQ